MSDKEPNFIDFQAGKVDPARGCYGAFETEVGGEPREGAGFSGKYVSAADAAPEVNRLRMLLRTNRIGKEAFCGGIATLMATGVISKAEFARLSMLAK